MSDPSLEMQGAMFTVLHSDAAVSSFVARRIYDRVPETTTFPYLQFGSFQTLDDGAECIDATEVFATIHVWSRTVGQVEAKRIASAVRAALHDKPLALSSFRVVDLRHRSTVMTADPDGESTHGVITFRALIDLI